MIIAIYTKNKITDLELRLAIEFFKSIGLATCHINDTTFVARSEGLYDPSLATSWESVPAETLKDAIDSFILKRKTSTVAIEKIAA